MHVTMRKTHIMFI